MPMPKHYSALLPAVLICLLSGFLPQSGLVSPVALAALPSPADLPDEGFAPDEGYGAEVNPTGNPIGGGEGYSNIILTGDYLVQSADELLRALAAAKPGQVVYVLPEAVIDLTGYMNILIPSGVTLAGNRGHNGAPGPLLFTNDPTTRPLFRIDGPNVRLTGLRIQGPNGEVGEERDAVPRSGGIQVNNDAEIDNNEIYNWVYGGVIVSGAAQNAYIHHNYIHHCQWTGLGYGVVVHNGFMVVEANIFDYYRHAIAGNGVLGSGYEARYNLVLSNAVSHAFDMHGGGDYCPKQNNNCTAEEMRSAGDRVHIHHNTFLVTQQTPIVIRGVPRESLKVHHNWFSDPNPALALRFRYYNGGNTHVHDNVYGREKVLVKEQIKPEAVIRKGDVHGKGTIVALTTSPDPVHLGFISIPGSVVKGKLPVEVRYDMGRGMQVERVEIFLDGRLIYSGPAGPEPGELTVDTTALTDGRHELTLALTAADPSLGTISETTSFFVQNWWRLDDDLPAPMDAGWLGVIKLTMTNAESAGWLYVANNPEEFAGDESRRVRSSLTEEWLSWETKNLRTYKVVVYSRQDLEADPAGYVQLAVSPDQTGWVSLTPAVAKVKYSTAAAGGWDIYELSGEIPPGMAVNYFRLSVRGGEAPDDIQIGAVSFIGLAE